MRLTLNLHRTNFYKSYDSGTYVRMLSRKGDFRSDEDADRAWIGIYDRLFADSREIELDDDLTLADLVGAIVREFKLHYLSRGDGEQFLEFFQDSTSPSNPPQQRWQFEPTDQTGLGFERLQLVHFPIERELYVFPAQKQLLASQSDLPELTSRLTDLEIFSEDVIQVDVKKDDGVRYYMSPVSNATEFRYAVVAKSQELAQAFNTPALCGALLYTDEDEELVKYVRKHFTSLSTLTGEHLHVYMIERPTLGADLRYWKGMLQKEFYQLWGVMRVLDTTPYSRSQSYEIAASLGIEPARLPCLVIFDYLERQNKLIFPIDEVSPAYFRHLLGSLNAKISETFPPPEPGSEPDNSGSLDIFAGFWATTRATRQAGSLADAFELARRSYVDIINSCQVVRDGRHAQYKFDGHPVFISHLTQEITLSETFNFNAETTFINKPANTIIQDFQNKYLASENAGSKEILEQLAALVKLVATSADLGQEDRADSLKALDATASEVKDGKADRITIKGRLQVLRETLKKAADIAVPALNIIAALVTIFALV
jgi:hypothetical protein